MKKQTTTNDIKKRHITRYEQEGRLFFKLGIDCFPLFKLIMANSKTTKHQYKIEYDCTI